MYVCQLFKNVLSVANRQRYVKVLPVGMQRLALFSYDHRRFAVSNYLLKISGALSASPNSLATSVMNFISEIQFL